MKCALVFRLWVIHKPWDGLYNHDNLSVILKIGHIYTVLILNCRKRSKHPDHYDHGMAFLVYLTTCMIEIIFAHDKVHCTCCIRAAL